MSTKNISVAEFLTKHINNSGKSQTEIAKILGYPNPNIITMFKQGRTKLPLTKIPQMASALELDPVYVMKVVMTEYSPETWVTLENIMGQSLISAAEMSAVKIIRAEVGDLEGVSDLSKKLDQLKTLAKEWKVEEDSRVEPTVTRH